MGLTPAKLEKPRKIWNVDNTENKAGMITHYLDLDVETKGIHKEMRFLITCHGRSVFAFIFEVVIIRYDNSST